jgi:hypothetical protein
LNLLGHPSGFPYLNDCATRIIVQTVVISVWPMLSKPTKVGLGPVGAGIVIVVGPAMAVVSVVGPVAIAEVVATVEVGIVDMMKIQFSQIEALEGYFFTDAQDLVSKDTTKREGSWYLFACYERQSPAAKYLS